MERSGAMTLFLKHAHTLNYNPCFDYFSVLMCVFSIYSGDALLLLKLLMR